MIRILIILLLFATNVKAATTLQQDGVDTPEQISIFLSMDSAPPSTMTTTMRYRLSPSGSWVTGHDLYRIAEASADQGFAWVITGLDQGTDYDVEVTTWDGGSDTVYGPTTMSTSSLPPAAGTVTITIPAGSTESEIETLFATASGDDVIQFEDGTYVVTGLRFNEGGTEGHPIYIRGESRDGVIIHDNDDAVISFGENAKYVVLENITLKGDEIDSGLSQDSTGISTWGGYSETPSEYLTFRNLNITGVDSGITAETPPIGFLIYENVLEGNNTWTQDYYAYSGSGTPGGGDGTPDIDQNIFWNDTCLKMGGNGNAIFNNTFNGFGDTVKQSAGGDRISLHFYRNNVTMAGDDGFEADGGVRNITLYDNRITNAATCVSVDQWGNGGPFLYFRNICINPSRQPLKLGGTSGATGEFFYNNTFVQSRNANNAFVFGATTRTMDYIGFQNNILITQYDSTVYTLYLAMAGIDHVDFTHNSWYPDEGWHWTYDTTETYGSLAEMQSGIRLEEEVFSGGGVRHANDLISELQPFETAVVLGSNYYTEITTMYTPSLTASGVSDGTGTAIVGVTDGYDDTNPDRGAIISGRDAVTYGATVASTTAESEGISGNGITLQ